jgi:Ca2+-binding RTX toxin-like protein
MIGFRRFCVPVLVLWPLLALAPSRAGTGRTTCHGRVATIVGTTAADTLTGTARSDVIVGLDGEDRIRGRGGTDFICGGSNPYERDRYEFLSGGRGDDRIAGGWSGRNWVVGGPGRDHLVGGSRQDRVTGGGRRDVVRGGGGIDLLHGEQGDDVIRGGTGDDAFFESARWEARGDDSLHGGPGSDSGFFGGGSIRVNLARGRGRGDRIGVNHLSSIEGAAVFQGGAAVLLGNSRSNELSGWSGADIVKGRGGDDTLSGWPRGSSGGAGNMLVGGRGDDSLFGNGEDDSIVGGPGSDTVAYSISTQNPLVIDLSSRLVTGLGTDTLTSIENALGGRGDDALRGSSRANRLDGWRGDDDIVGLAGDDYLDGGSHKGGSSGIDSLDGGPGTDTCVNGESYSQCEP